MNSLDFSKTALLSLALPAAGTRLNYYDARVRKLALRVTHTGAKTFYVVKRVGANMAWVRLGSFPEMTVEQARKEAAKILGEFASGANPAEARQKLRGEPSFEEAFAVYLEKKRKRDGSPIGDRTKRDYTDIVKKYLKGIRAKKLSQITRTDVRTLHQAVTEVSAAQADKALAIVSGVFRYAVSVEWFSGKNPTVEITKNPAVTRERFALGAELPFLLESVAKSTQRDYFLMSLLTGARRSNVQAMAWHELDLQEAVWNIRMTKNGTPQTVPLSPEVVAVLRERQQSATSPFVFPGTGTTGHLVEPKNAWATVLRRASTCWLMSALEMSDDKREALKTLCDRDLTAASESVHSLAKTQTVNASLYDMTDLRIHDLRRTLGSWQAKTGASLVIIGKSLNHKSQQSTAIYARLDLDPVRQSINTATAAMMEAAGLKSSADVIPFSAKAQA